MRVKVIKPKQVTLDPLVIGPIAPWPRKLHAVRPWSVKSFDQFSNILAHVELSGQVEIVAVTQSLNHKAIADHLAWLVNLYNRNPGSFVDAANMDAEKRHA